MSQVTQIEGFIGGTADGGPVVWDNLAPVQFAQSATATGAILRSAYRLVRGSVLGEDFVAYVDNDMGKEEALNAIARRLISIRSIGY
ncbi:hypothetical protein ACM726_02550 [Pseudomonas aeruginosa]|uniref:hypothetical protein n=1 Tax=Pseudomonas aeruginosa TaxID=287 RepID=UPI001F472D2E|nr:hypothetical protein [Pseudomonas aeruginosa]MCY0282071.1 hypothetical protein [Pseudomonas aeruginosa]MCY0412004.1 hypothetical protein [Pseudomonas aeruginosa]MDG4275979.1 hypothetical protein [Pseudomonas aeruginosa]HBP0349234.1 hypothetical protein [Pseudomonas aeruginosa]HCI2725705.1 hypothetical protein [Pseudomonas aeruginosa]